MKRMLALIMVIALAAVPLHLQGKDIHLKIAVRVAKAGGVEKELEKKDFQLYINGAPREIEEFFKKSRSIEKTKTKRSFCLAFNFTDYETSISDAIAHFVSNTLTDNDRLIVWSPLKKIYRIDVRRDKQKIIDDIQKLIKDDSLNYKKNLEVVKDNLEGLIKKLNTQGLGTTNIQYFLNNYLREFTNFKNRYLIPDVNKYGGVAALMARHAGEKWLINFQEREVIPSIPQYRKIRDEIRTLLSSLTGVEQSLASSINSGLVTIDKAMILSENFPTQEIMDMMLGTNISYNAIFFRSMRKESRSIADTVSPDYEDILKKIANCTGGTTIVSNDFQEGLVAIKKKEDFYYDLVFKFNGKPEDKEIKVEIADRKAKINHKARFLEAEIKAIIDIAEEPTVQIVDYKLKGRSLGFTVSGYKIDRDEQSETRNLGIIRIDIKLIDEKHNVVFKPGKTFKTANESFNINLNLPAKAKGYFKLSIVAEDLVSGRDFELNKYVKLK